MRAPGHKRRRYRRVVSPVAGVDLSEIAERVSYVGSAEHKDMPSFAGQPRPRVDASICPRRLSRDQERVTQWLKTAIRSGATGEELQGGFPKYAWYKEEGVVYEARLVNPGLGEYKGFPLNATEWPDGLDSIYE